MDIGIALRAEVDLFLFTVRLTVSALIQMWGPPDGGVLHLDTFGVDSSMFHSALRARVQAAVA